MGAGWLFGANTRMNSRPLTSCLPSMPVRCRQLALKTQKTFGICVSVHAAVSSTNTRFSSPQVTTQTLENIAKGTTDPGIEFFRLIRGRVAVTGAVKILALSRFAYPPPMPILAHLWIQRQKAVNCKAFLQGFLSKTWGVC